MSFSCASPTSISEEDWINEIFSFSPLDLTQSNDVKSQLALPPFGPASDPYLGQDSPPDTDFFSGSSSGYTLATTPGTAAQSPAIKSNDNKLLDSVSLKLQKLKEENRLSPKALESVFNTQDVLAEPIDKHTDLTKNKHRKCRGSSPNLQGARKRKNLRSRAPKSAHHAGQNIHLAQKQQFFGKYSPTAEFMKNYNPESDAKIGAGSSNCVLDTLEFPESWFQTEPEPVLGKPQDAVLERDVLKFAPYMSQIPELDSVKPEPVSAVADISAFLQPEGPSSLFASAGPTQMESGFIGQNSNGRDAVLDPSYDKTVSFMEFLQAGDVLLQKGSSVMI